MQHAVFVVLQHVEHITFTTLLCYALVSEVDLALSIKCYVLKKSVSLDRIVDVRLRLFVKVDNLSVASEVKADYGVDVLESTADKGYECPEDHADALANGIVVRYSLMASISK